MGCIDKLNSLGKDVIAPKQFLDTRTLIHLYTMEHSTSLGEMAQDLKISRTKLSRLASNQMVMDDGTIEDGLRRYAATLNYNSIRKKLDELEEFARPAHVERAKKEFEKMMTEHRNKTDLLQAKKPRYSFDTTKSTVYVNWGNELWLILYDEVKSVNMANEKLKAFMVLHHGDIEKSEIPVRISLAITDRELFEKIQLSWQQNKTRLPNVGTCWERITLSLLLCNPIDNTVEEDLVVRHPAPKKTKAPKSKEKRKALPKKTTEDKTKEKM